MKLLFFLLVFVCVRTGLSCVPPAVTTDYNFQYNVTQIDESLDASIRVECTATPATDVSSYVWQKNEENIQEPTTFPVFLIISNLAVEDGGQYRCKVTTTSCGIIYSTEISINTPPDQVMITGPSTVDEENPFQLTCSAIGWPPPTYEWRFNGGLVGMGSVYSVISAMLSDSGEYTCIARNSRGQIADEVDLTVVEVIPKVTTKADTTTPPSFSKPSISTITTTQDKTTQPLFPTTTTQDKTTQPLFPTTTTQDKTTQPLFPTTTTQDTTTQPLFSTTDDPTKVSTSESSVTMDRAATSHPDTVKATRTISPTPTYKDPSATRDSPAALFIVLLALSIALLVALVGIICIIFVLTVYVLRLPSRRKDDDERPLTEEAEGGCGDEIKTTDSCPEKLSTHMAEKAPLSYINIAFGQESDEEDEGEGEGEMGGEKDTDLSGGADAKLSPQRYQPSSKPASLSKTSSLPSSDQPHSVSMDVPGEQAVATRPGVSHRKPVGESGKMHHLTPPVDRHRVGHKKGSRTRGWSCLSRL